MKSEDFDAWLRTARRILAGRPHTIGLLSVGTPPLDSAAVSRRLAHAMSRLVGQAVGLILPWRCWRGPSAQVLTFEQAEVVVMSPAAEADPVVAAGALEVSVAQARASFPHLLVDLAGLPLRHPSTLACADVLVTLAPAGRVREEHLLATERLLPEERNLGVVLIG